MLDGDLLVQTKSDQESGRVRAHELVGGIFIAPLQEYFGGGFRHGLKGKA